MSTLGVMKTRIADELVRDDLSSQIGNAITTALSLWAPTRFHFNEKRYLLTTVADTEYYAMSDLTNTDGTALDSGETLIEIDSFTLTYANQPYPLEQQTQGVMDREQANASQYTGQPYAYAMFGDKIRLSPIPDAAYACTISGLAQLGTLTTDGSTNAWMTDAEALIRNQAKALIYRDILRDGEGLSIARDALSEALEPLKRRMAAKAFTGRIAPWVL